ncbi:MAG: response regulator [Burkholderiaceae bacterium]|nr:response regulator [Burkholderiaceae bacterium]
MNTIFLWAVPLAGLLALLGWAVLRRRSLRDRPAAAPRPPESAAAAAPPAAADAARLAAQHQAATEALRQARRRKAEDEARRATELAVQRPSAPVAARPSQKPAADPVRPGIARPAPPLPQADAPADPVVPILSPLAIQRHTGRSPPPTAGLAPLRTAVRPSGPPTVLVVDDSKVVRVKTGRLFEKQGWRVLLADDGQAALACLEDDAPDLLITDVEMPGLDGFALTRCLRGQPRWAGLPVVMITSSDDKHRAEAAAAGVDVLLGKPYADDALLAQARVLVGAGAPVLH